MSTRPQVVQKIRLLAFDAVRDDLLPEDITIHEQAEGLISFAMSLLRYHSGPEEAELEGCRLVKKHREMVTCYFG